MTRLARPEDGRAGAHRPEAIPWTSRRRPRSLRYGVAVSAAVVGLVVLSLPEIGRSLSYVLFFAVVVAAWYGGLGPGLVATGLMVVAAVTIFALLGHALPPLLLVQVILFIAGGVVISVLVEALHGARRRLASVLTSIGDAVIATDARGRVTFANPVAEALTGWAMSEAAGRPLEEVFRIVSESTRAPIESPVARVLRDGLVVGLANSSLLIARDGAEWPIADSAAPVVDEGGAVRGVVLVFREVSERRRWEEALRRSEAHRRAMVEQVEGYAIFTLDPAGRATSWNGGVRRVLGYEEPEFLGLPLARLYPADGVAAGAPERELAEAAARGQAATERWQVRRDGARFWAGGITTALRDPSGQLVGYTVVMSDRTERRRAEAERAELLEREQAARAEAEAASRAKDRFLAVLSHELRTPLTPVLLAASAALEAGGVDRATLEMIRRNVELEARLIDDLLDVVRIGRGALQLAPEVLDAHEALRRAVAICREDTAAAGLALELELGAAQSLVRADPARLLQVFWNLIRNAAKFTPAGGSLTIRTADAPAPAGDPAGGRLVVEFRDTGAGIAPGLLGRIFEPFEQGAAGLRGRQEGLGLGLAIARAVAEAHGGTLTARSPGPGLGSTFRLELPAAAPAERAPVAASPPPIPGAGGPALRVLLVEDNRDTLRYLEAVLRARGHAVTPAASLAEARAAAADGAGFDLLLSDIELPDGTGLELMAELAGRRVAAGLAMSGYGSEDDVRQSLAAGFAAHLTKPVDLATLEGAIRGVASEGGPSPASGSLPATPEPLRAQPR